MEFSRPVTHPARARALVFESPPAQALLKLLERIAPTDTTVLVTGETGTGKEVVARYLHEHSPRAASPFLAVNCGAISAEPARKRAIRSRARRLHRRALDPPWVVEAAHRGTLFLDEVADLPLAGQVKLLRVLQEREVVRVGGRRASPVDVRLIAATNANLQSAVAEGRFREDLFYRLHVAHAPLAPLRERREDILPLARHFLARHAARFGISDAKLADGAIEKLVRHDWPGNIRELENVIQRALLAAPHATIDAEHVRLVIESPASSASSWPPVAPLEPAALTAPATEASRLDEARMGLEQAMLVLLESGEPRLFEAIDAIVFRAAFRVARKNQVRTAQLLGISRNIVRSRLMRYGLLAADARRSLGLRLAEEKQGPASSYVRAALGAFAEGEASE